MTFLSSGYQYDFFEIRSICRSITVRYTRRILHFSEIYAPINLARKNPSFCARQDRIDCRTSLVDSAAWCVYSRVSDVWMFPVCNRKRTSSTLHDLQNVPTCDLYSLYPGRTKRHDCLQSGPCLYVRWVCFCRIFWLCSVYRHHGVLFFYRSLVY